MNRLFPVVIALVFGVTVPSVFPQGQQPVGGAQPQGPDMNAYYQIGPDSLSHDGVPKGDVRGPFILPSQAYPGTQHTYWVYVPAQYDPKVSVSLMIFQDGQAFKDMDGVLRTLPEMMSWLWRDHPVSTEPNDAVEWSFNEPRF